MKKFSMLGYALAALVISAANAQSVPERITTSPQVDPNVYSGRLKVNYPTAYELAAEPQIRATLDRLHGYVDVAAPISVLNADSGEKVADLAQVADKHLARAH